MAPKLIVRLHASTDDAWGSRVVVHELDPDLATARWASQKLHVQLETVPDAGDVTTEGADYLLTLERRPIGGRLAVYWVVLCADCSDEHVIFAGTIKDIEDAVARAREWIADHAGEHDNG